jgi:hypothetical protein
VIIEADDIYGDGVNIAARLQEVAIPGGVYISGTVFEQVDGKIDQQFGDLGSQQFKNIAKPIHVYSAHLMDVATAGTQRPFFSTSSAAGLPLTGGCLCGAVRYEISAPAIDVNYCHCRMCQRFTGGLIVAGAHFPMEAFRFTQGEPKYYKSSPIAERGFCADCGSSIIYRCTASGARHLMKVKWSEWYWVLVANLDNPENCPSGLSGTGFWSRIWTTRRTALPSGIWASKVRCPGSTCTIASPACVVRIPRASLRPGKASACRSLNPI